MGVLHILEQLSYFVIICASSLLARRKPTFEYGTSFFLIRRYSYGYNRHEVLAVFTVSISVIFVFSLWHTILFFLIDLIILLYGVLPSPQRRRSHYLHRSAQAITNHSFHLSSLHHEYVRLHSQSVLWQVLSQEEPFLYAINHSFLHFQGLLQMLTDEDVLLYMVDLAFFFGAHSASVVYSSSKQSHKLVKSLFGCDWRQLLIVPDDSLFIL